MIIVSIQSAFLNTLFYLALTIKTAKELNFRGIQFNAVVESNKPALHIYKSLGFKEVGMIPGGFMLKDGSYSNMYILYLSLL